MKQVLIAAVFVLGMGCAAAAFAADTLGRPVLATTTEHVAFAAGGTIHINGSYGTLNIEGWDQPEVEITVTRSLPLRFGESKAPDAGPQRLETVHVATTKQSATELTIGTTLTVKHSKWVPAFLESSSTGVDADYQIRVPRNSHLEIQHGAGFVQVRGVTGDIDGSVRRGDLLLWLPPGAYSVDAKTKIGMVSSELAGVGRNHYVTGERYVGEGKAPAHRLNLRMGFGGITIRQVPVETADSR